MAAGRFMHHSIRISRIVAKAVFDGSSATLADRAMPADFLARSPSGDVTVSSDDAMAVGGALHCIAAATTLKDDLRYHGRGCGAVAWAVAAKEGTEACFWASSPTI